MLERYYGLTRGMLDRLQPWTESFSRRGGGGGRKSELAGKDERLQKAIGGVGEERRKAS